MTRAKLGVALWGGAIGFFLAQVAASSHLACFIALFLLVGLWMASPAAETDFKIAMLASFLACCRTAFLGWEALLFAAIILTMAVLSGCSIVILFNRSGWQWKSRSQRYLLKGLAVSVLACDLCGCVGFVNFNIQSRRLAMAQQATLEQEFVHLRLEQARFQQSLPEDRHLSDKNIAQMSEILKEAVQARQ